MSTNGDTPHSTPDARTADLTDPDKLREVLIYHDETVKETHHELRRHHLETMRALGKVSAALKTVLDELADHSRTLIALDAWRITTAKHVIPQHEQRMREIEGQLKAEAAAGAAARRKDRMQLKDLKEDVEVVTGKVEEVTGKHEAMKGEALAKAEKRLETIDARSFEWRKLVVGAAITFAVLSPWAAFLAWVLRGGK